MFTQEQLGAIKGVVIEAVTPLVDNLEKKMDAGFQKMEEGFEKMDEKIDNLEKHLVERMDDGFSAMNKKIDFVDQKLDRIGLDVDIVKGDVARIKLNKPMFFVRDGGDDSYNSNTIKKA